MMKRTLSLALRLYRRHFGQLMLMLFLQLVLLLMVCTPLLFLSNPATRPLALLSIALFILAYLPIRQNAAEVMQHLIDTDEMRLTGLVSLHDYGHKLGCALRRAGLLLLWALPFLAVTATGVYVFKADTIVGVTDTFTLLKNLQALGANPLTVALLPNVALSTVRGIIALVVLYLLTLLPFVFGLGFHCGARHAEARTGSARLIRGHRCGVLLTWLIGLLTLVPFAAAVALISRDYLHQLLSVLSNFGMTSLALPPLDQRAYLAAACFVVLLLPFVPLKQLLPACRVALLDRAHHAEAQA